MNNPARLYLRYMRIVRPMRLKSGLSQNEFAEILGCSQSKLSKIESSLLMLNFDQYISLSRNFGVTIDSMALGYMDIKPIKKRIKYTDLRGFSSSSKYHNEFTVKNRTLIPFLETAKTRIGEDKLNQLITDLEFKPHYFIIANDEVSIFFFRDLLQAINKEIGKKMDIVEIFNNFDYKEDAFHYFNYFKLSKLTFQRKPESLNNYFKEYFGNIFDYKLNDNLSVDLAPSEQVHEYYNSLDSEFINFFKQYVEQLFYKTMEISGKIKNRKSCNLKAA